MKAASPGSPRGARHSATAVAPQQPVLEPGLPYPLGASVRDGGVNVVVFSDHASAIELCLFDADGTHERARLPLHGPDDGLWHGFLPGATAGLVYGLRAHGPWAPSQGHVFNPNKLLLDPCAREIVGRWSWGPEHFGQTPDGQLDRRDNAAWALKTRVAQPAQPAPGLANAPRHAERDLVVYEVHVKNFSIQHPDIPPALRGTYSALAHPAALAHFRRLGVTAVELLPVHYHLDEAFLARHGLSNHWGYNTLGFCCPDPRYALQPHDPSAINDEFRRMVATLHQHGIEVWLDVVYNHTAEAGHDGPTLSFRGLDQASWYRLEAGGRSVNYSGCGNTLNTTHPRVVQFVMDSLRVWAHEFGVDGFRFDLAPVLGRQHPHFDPRAPFFAAAAQDPVLARTRLVAEAWDSGPDGYQVGRFPAGWLEWNDKFRDSVRRFWLGQGTSRAEFARRFAASDDLFHHGGRRPTASVNFIAAHDGFTLADFTSHSAKHNHANGENNADGRHDEACANFGAEGPSSDAGVVARRTAVRRALMATLLLAQGTPMINAGDELLRSQQGNNNAWNQDNPIGWVDWAAADTAFADFTARVLALRHAEPALRHARWFTPQSASRAGEPVMHWASVSAQPLTAPEWHDPSPRALACLLEGPAQAAGGPEPAASDALLLAFNPGAGAVDVQLPGDPQRQWTLALDTSQPTAPETAISPGAPARLAPLSLAVWRSRRPAPSEPPSVPSPRPSDHPPPAA